VYANAAQLSAELNPMTFCGYLATHELSKRLSGVSDSPIMEVGLYEARGAADETTGPLAASVTCHLASLPLWTDVGAPDNPDARGTVTLRITSLNRQLPPGAQPGLQIALESQCQAPR
jgi:hypothetical protein